MKHLLILTSFILSLALSAETAGTVFHFNNISQESLMLDGNSIELILAHPGETVSGVCQLEIVVNSRHRGYALNDFFDAIKITGGTSAKVASDTVIRIELTKTMPFLTFVGVNTKNGKSIKEVAKNILGQNSKLVIRPRSCD